MGQQQLLLIVLGVIIVGIAVVVGINTFSAGATQANKDACIADALAIASDAQGWYRKPIALGGGGGSFSQYDNTRVPPQLRTTENMSVAANVAGSDSTLTITITGNEPGVSVILVTGPSAIQSTTATP